MAYGVGGQGKINYNPNPFSLKNGLRFFFKGAADFFGTPKEDKQIMAALPESKVAKYLKSGSLSDDLIPDIKDPQVPKGFLNKATPLAPLQQSNLYAGLRNADVDNAMRTLFNKQVHQDDNVTKFIRGQGVDLTIPIQGPTIRGA